jgi:hypothetical protein
MVPGLVLVLVLEMVLELVHGMGLVRTPGHECHGKFRAHVQVV